MSPCGINGWRPSRSTPAPIAIPTSVWARAGSLQFGHCRVLGSRGRPDPVVAQAASDHRHREREPTSSPTRRGSVRDPFRASS